MKMNLQTAAAIATIVIAIPAGIAVYDRFIKKTA
jgi:hypothetical protein